MLCGWMHDRESRKPSTHAAATYILVSIPENGSLYNSVSKYTPEFTTADRFLEEVAALNKLNGYTVYEGQKLLVPIYSK